MLYLYFYCCGKDDGISINLFFVSIYFLFFLPDGTNYLPNHSMMTSCTGKILSPSTPLIKTNPMAPARYNRDDTYPP